MGTSADLSGPEVTTDWVQVDLQPSTSAQIPTLSEWGMIVLVLLLTGTGMYLVMRRRRQVEA